MQTKAILVCLALLLPRVGTVKRAVRADGAQPSVLSPGRPEIEDLRNLHRRGMELYQKGRYAAAIETYRDGVEQARRRQEPVAEMRFLINLGSCQFALLRYQDAMRAYLEARGMAESLGDREMVAALSGNLSSLYFQTGDMESADQAATAGLAALGTARKSEFRAQLLLQKACVRARLGDGEALSLFADAIQQADRAGKDDLAAQAFNLLGYELLTLGRLEPAESALIEAFRIRSLTRSRDLGQSYRPLAQLRLRQGDLEAVARLADLAVAAALRAPMRFSVWSAYYVRGLTRAAQGKLLEALEDYRRALDWARRWRLEVLPADAVRASSDVALQEIYSAFIAAGVRLAAGSRRGVLVHQTFEAAEENRAASLRALLAQEDGWQARLPAEYGQRLAELRSLETALLVQDTPDARARASRARQALVEMEAGTGLAVEGARSPEPEPGLLAGHVQRTLAPDEVLLTFHVAEPESVVWRVTRDRIELWTLAGKARLEAQVSAFADAVARGSHSMYSLGQALYSQLFGDCARLRSARHWVLALDDTLFQLPWSALVTGGTAENPEYLIQRHSIRIIPSAYCLGQATRERGQARHGLVAIGDPVYNQADPRRRASSRSPHSQAFNLPRLAGSAQEIRTCARAWAPERTQLIEGERVSRQALAEALVCRPQVLHIAAHVVPSRRRLQGLIALGLRPDGEIDLLTPREIALLRPAPPVVVLSGCRSVAGQVLPGAGLMGLTRAWLGAGAEAVAASLWPVGDSNGEIFLPFYGRLRECGRAEQALQFAQAEMIQSGGWRSQPRYWAAYSLLTKE